MATAIEMLGLSLPYSSSFPADSKEKQNECLRAGEAMKVLLEKDIKPLDIQSREAFENAITITMALGGSTNAVLHLIAIACAANIPLTINDFEKVSERVPSIADLKPSGKYVMEDIHRIGGTPDTLGEKLNHVPDLSDNHEIIHPVDRPLKSSGHLRILRGDLASEGSVAKITGKEGLLFTGTAKVYDCEEDMTSGLEKNEITKGSVVIIRYEGPKIGPACLKCVTTRLQLMKKIIGLIDVSAEELAQRKKEWIEPPLKATRGMLYKFIKNVKSASEGCITDE
ncbi:hypothetical protein PsorP6_007991 [Peronosclerospora sorghi]|uniref:Uncharacterized protein n=1 Tax=Peronosclerospora sorghi TaxID=230839 RepID=A0ACC0WDD4_9STRA|nr:hypothetical protein PsorP6_007991 [Peronosclerospora sorghi]